MTEQGFGPCYNVAGGFEGPPDGDRHRGTVGGWKAAGLPTVVVQEGGYLSDALGDNLAAFLQEFAAT